MIDTAFAIFVLVVFGDGAICSVDVCRYLYNCWLV